MDEDFEFDDSDFDLEKFLKDQAQTREEEYKKLSYQERMEIESKRREAKRASKEHWERFIKPTKDISIAYAEISAMLYGDFLDEYDHVLIRTEEYRKENDSRTDREIIDDVREKINDRKDNDTENKIYQRYVKQFEEYEVGLYTNEELSYYYSIIDTAYDNNDLEMMDKIYSQIQLKRKERVMNFWHYEISKIIGWEQNKLQRILDKIKNEEEARIIRNHIVINYSISSLPKGYSLAKKNKQRYRRLHKRPYTYEQQIKKSRRILEKQLQRAGAGLKHSQSLSQILSYL